MGEDTAAYMRKVKRAAKILFYKRHRQPGVKGWELSKSLGKNYLKIIDLLNRQLEKLDLQVKAVYEAGEEPENPTDEELKRARFYITLKEPLSSSDLLLSGWRVDDVAALTVAVAHIISKQGKAPRKEVEEILREKFPKWRVDYNLNRFLRNGYLSQDDDGFLYLNWRARAEIDQKTLLKLVLAE
jgi:hypothetical protein